MKIYGKRKSRSRRMQELTGICVDIATEALDVKLKTETTAKPATCDAPGRIFRQTKRKNI